MYVHLCLYRIRSYMQQIFPTPLMDVPNKKSKWLFCQIANCSCSFLVVLVTQLIIFVFRIIKVCNQHYKLLLFTSDYPKWWFVHVVFLLLLCIPICCVFLSLLGNTVKPPNRGHFGDNINSAVFSFVERGCPLSEVQNVFEL